MLKNKKILLASIILIRDLWNNDRKEKALKTYLKLINKLGDVNGTYDIRQYSQIQIDDMILTFSHPEVLWLRSRRAGKTRDMTVLCVFYTIVGLTCNWFSVTLDQLEAVRTWFELNPYTEYVTNDVIKIINCNNIINFGILSSGQVVSKGANCLFYDELRSCPIKDLKFHYYLTSRGQLTASSFFKIISGTTAETGSAEQHQYNSLSNTDFDAISIHPWYDFPHLNEDFINHEKEQHLEDPWYVDQEYLCKHVVRGGAVFENITDISLDALKSLSITHVGIDINKYEMAVGLHITNDRKNCYVLFEKEYNYVANQNCFDELRSKYIMYKNRKIDISNNIVIEIENGGYNEKECYIVCSKINAIPKSWSGANKDREVGERQNIGRQFEHIYVCRSNTPRIYDDLVSMVFQQTKPIYLKDNTHPCHWSDAFLHALNIKDGKGLYFNERAKTQFDKNPFLNPKLTYFRSQGF